MKNPEQALQFFVMYEALLDAVVGEQSSFARALGGAGGLALLEWPRLCFLATFASFCASITFGIVLILS